MTTRMRELEQMSIFELVKLTYNFIRFELIHAGVAVGVFGVIFVLLLRPWDSTYYYTTDTHAFWFVGPPLIYFTLDLCCAVFLHFSLKNELKPKPCFVWILLQIGNLILLTFLGFYMVWTYYYRGNTYLRLTIALIVLYCYKAYRMSQLYKIVVLIRNRCLLTSTFANGIPIQHIQVSIINEKPSSVTAYNESHQSQFPNVNPFPASFSMKT